MNPPKAIIIGASSGIGRALAQVLAENGYTLGLAARRANLLKELRFELHTKTIIKAMDLARFDESARRLGEMIAELGGVDLVVICAGVGFENPDLGFDLEKATIDVNVSGFVLVCSVVLPVLIRQGHGHIVGISSIAAIRGSGVAPAYGASKAFESNYLQALRDKVRKECPAVVITDVQPGFVDTAMAKSDRLFWVAPPRKAALQIYRAIKRKRKHVYITRRWRLIAWIFKIMPR